MGIAYVIPHLMRDPEDSMRQYYVYILASRRNGTLYVGMTNDLGARVHQHKSGQVEGFTKKYGVHTLVYYERFARVHEAIAWEKKLKRWRRKWKIDLIERFNPQWKDLSESGVEGVNPASSAG